MNKKLTKFSVTKQILTLVSTHTQFNNNSNLTSTHAIDLGVSISHSLIYSNWPGNHETGFKPKLIQTWDAKFRNIHEKHSSEKILLPYYIKNPHYCVKNLVIPETGSLWACSLHDKSSLAQPRCL